MYKEKLNLIFLYGKKFRSKMKHLENIINVDSFLKYILNNKTNQKIKEGTIDISRSVENYIKQNEIYNKNSFENIWEYITSLFQEKNKH